MRVRTSDVLSVRHGASSTYEAIRIGQLHGVYVRFERLGLGESTWYEQQIALQDVISKIVNESTSNAASRITCISLKAV